MESSILQDLTGFRHQVIEALSREPVDYVEKFAFLHRKRETTDRLAGGGVLLPLFFQREQESGEPTPAQYVFLLNKRSKKVLQPGDLCAPGGGIRPFLDSLIQKLLKFRLLPRVGGPGLGLARRNGKESYEKILFLLGNALRESWEELRLSPFNVEFLGPLPTYQLTSRRWIIFPLVGRVKHSWRPKLSWEVEKIVPIPLSAFFDPRNYAVYSLEVPEKLVAQGIPSPWEFPCLVHIDNGEEELLWGATFQIIQTFFHIVFDFSFPPPPAGRVIRRPLASNYLSGREG